MDNSSSIDYQYHGSDIEISGFINGFTSRILDGSGDPEEDFTSCVRLAGLCKHGGKFLDIGSGLGRLVGILHPHAGHLVGLEPDLERFSLCYAAYKNCGAAVEILNVTCGDYMAQNPGQKFDLVTAAMVIQHVSTSVCDEILNDVRSMLSEDGVGIVSTTHFHEEKLTFEREFEHHTVEEFDRYASDSSIQNLGIPVRMFSRKAFTQALERAKLKVIMWRPYTYVREEKLKNFSNLFRTDEFTLRNMAISQYAIVQKQ